MNKNEEQLYQQLKQKGLSPEQEEIIKKELDLCQTHSLKHDLPPMKNYYPGLYEKTDLEVLQEIGSHNVSPFSALKTLDELLEHDKQRDKDGFPRRIRIGKLIKPSRGSKGNVIIVPTTTEPKFYHDDSVTEEGDEETTGGSGEGDEGEVLGEQPIQPQEEGEGEGEEGQGQGAGEGEGAEHDISSEAFDIGRVITEKFELPNLKQKGHKKSFTKYTYDLTDKNRGFGQVLDKKSTLRKIVETNILLERIKESTGYNTEDLLINPNDHIYKILSKEKDYETQAIVFFLRDYSGSMGGEPTEVVTTQHFFIYSWLVYQYKNNVESRFILHDTDAKEVPDFYTYYKSLIAGGTKIAPAFELVNKIVEEEQLVKDYNIYVFHGTDGDDWDDSGKELMTALKKTLKFVNRVGITVAKNSWGASSQSIVEKNIINSGILKEKADLIRMDSFPASGASESRIIEGIKNLVS